MPKMPSEAEVRDARERIAVLSFRLRESEGSESIRYLTVAGMFVALCWAAGDEPGNALAEILAGKLAVIPDGNKESSRRG